MTMNDKLQTIRRLGTCPISGERCVITAEYREAYAYHDHRFIKERANCSLGPCERTADCREYDHFPAEYRF